MEKWDKQLAGMIDHTLLRADATEGDVRTLCEETLRYRFASAVVFPFYVTVANELLKGSGIPVCSVVSFPFGSHTPVEKALMAESLLSSGVGEIDMVMNIGAFLTGNMDVIKEELESVGSLCRGHTLVKLIIETACLDRKKIVKAVELGIEGGVDFIKTSTGMASSGASVEDVALIASTVGDHAGVKASGGIRSREFALALVEAGATRIGCSRSQELIMLVE